MDQLAERDDIGRLPLTPADRAYYNLRSNNAPAKVDRYIASMASHGGVPNGGRGFPTPDVGRQEGGSVGSGSKGLAVGRSKTQAQLRGSPWTHHDVTEQASKLVDALLQEDFPGYYEIVVGKIGAVYHGRDKAKADAIFDECVRRSERGSGETAHQPVTMFCDGNPCRNYAGMLVTTNSAN